MSDRLVTLLGALGALLLLLALLLPPMAEPGPARPTSEQAGPSGYLGLQRWLQQESVATVSLRRRFDSLAAMDSMPASGNLLISTLPHQHSVRRDEREALAGWLSDGNNLLLVAALNDTPKWSMGAGADNLLRVLRDLTGLQFEAAEDAAGDSIIEGSHFKPTPYVVKPLGTHPLLVDVSEMHGTSDAPTMHWQPRIDEKSPLAVALALDADSGRTTAWELGSLNGESAIVVVAHASLFSNQYIGAADNAAFFRNLVAQHTEPHGLVVFDDFHQGLSDLYDPEAFFADSRVALTAAFLLGFWLLYMVGTSARLAAPVVVPQQAKQGDLVHAIGGFMSRKLAPSDAGRVLIEGWVRELKFDPAQLTEADSGLWSRLHTMPLMDPEGLAAVQSAYAQLGRGESVDLAALHNNIQLLRRRMQ